MNRSSRTTHRALITGGAGFVGSHLTEALLEQGYAVQIVDDLSSGSIANPQAYGQVFNIGHTKDISIHELALVVKAMTKSPSDITFVPYEQAYEAGFEDMPRRLPDITKAQTLIGYQPTLDLPGMLEQIIGYKRKRLGWLLPEDA